MPYPSLSAYFCYDLLKKRALAFGSQNRFAQQDPDQHFHAGPDPEGKSFLDPRGSGSETMLPVT